jgi:ferredoxin-thioredoxin reductase catalytic chain
VTELLARLKKSVEGSGYYINPDREFTEPLLAGLLTNEKRYGYMSCPCRLGTGNVEEDVDILCPCDYRDMDVKTYGNCYCCLYVSGPVLHGEKSPASIPERRLVPSERRKSAGRAIAPLTGLPYPVWRCKSCGYLCAREDAPDICPICGARHEQFERFI